MTSVICLLAVLAGSSAWADSARDAIKAAEQQFAKLYNAKDAAGVANLYAHDALRLAPDASRVQGRAAIQAQLQKELDGGVFNFQGQVTDFASDGNLAWVVGNFSVDYTTEQGSKATATGNYISIYRKDTDGQWRVVVDTWNDAPAK
jgi:uncharacterized protein (TIGR02246 family)